MRILYLPNEYSQQRQRERKANIYPVLMAMEASYYAQDKENEVHWGWGRGKYDKVISEPEGLPFLSLPHPDRKLTKAFNPTYQLNGNYKYHPGTYIQSANGCWYGKCSFCVERNSNWQVREVEDVISEIEECKSLGFKEMFDDSASFPLSYKHIYNYLDDFCVAKYEKGLQKFPISCNMRIINNVDFKQMKWAGFRMLLFGIESANQYTLDRINKGVNADDIIPTIRSAARVGLEPHVAVMFGYPWENDEQSVATLRLVHYLLIKGYAKTAQASFYNSNIPNINYKPGEKTYIDRIYCNESQRKYIKRIYNAAFYPEFWFNQIRDIKNVADLKYLWLKIKKGLGR